MANTYNPQELGIQAPGGGFQQGGWYSGRQYWGGTLSDPGAIHPQSNQQGAGQLVSAEVNAQSAAAQGVTSQNLEAYLEQQRQQAANVQPAAQQTPVTRQASTTPTGATGTTGAGISQPQTPNLMEAYKTGMESPELKGLQEQLSGMDKEYIEAKGKINDNPFLSEATRVGRIAKIEKLYQERTANIRGDIATKKADVETQINLMTQQFNIDSQASQQALSQFNTLLQLGALDNASGEDIANMTRSTGISSDMIYSAIAANKKKNQNVGVQTFTAENGEVWAVAINQDTGDVVKKTSLGIIGNVQGSGTGTTEPKKSEITQSASQAAQAGKTYNDMLAFFVQYGMTPKDIYNVYTATNYYGRPPDNIDPKTGLQKVEKVAEGL